ncbi:hypothetical protein J4464_02470 [Candidatus Woesearchaeota archaeon]|nr:hypothetical protein [Candidatus Woesearchaeota archaeon]
MVSAFVLDILVFIVLSIPLYLAVRFLKGKPTIVNVLLVNLITGLMFSSLKQSLSLLKLALGLFLMLWLYHEIFRLKWIKAVLAWALQIAITIIAYVILVILLAILGITTNVLPEWTIRVF